jgi:IS1 family transposase
MVVSIAGRRMYMWRAVDSEGEVLDVMVQPRRDKAATVKLLRKLLKRQGFAPTVIVTDKLRSYNAALQLIGLSGQHEQGLRANNRAENSHQPVRRRERKMQLQIARFSSAFCRHPRRRLQHLQRPATPHPPRHPPPLPRGGSSGLERCDCCGLIKAVHKWIAPDRS